MGGHLADCHKWILIRHAVRNTNQTSSRGYISDKQSGNVANKTNQTTKWDRFDFHVFLSNYDTYTVKSRVFSWGPLFDLAFPFQQFIEGSTDFNRRLANFQQLFAIFLADV